jgi:hypothetical protein
VVILAQHIFMLIQYFTKHIEVDYHFVRERVAQKLLDIGLYLQEIKWLMNSPSHYLLDN